MNISLNWLSDYVEIDQPVKQLAELFTRIGLNCESISEAGDDIVLDLEVTSNRSDCLGHIGVARELSAATAKPLKIPETHLPKSSGLVEDFTSVRVDCLPLCPRYTARVIRNVKVTPSPQWLVDYLQALGMRSVNNVVDVTNFVLMECSQPLHSFDYDKLIGNRIIVRQAKKGETLVSIDETTCQLNEDMMIIADAERPVAIAGVMGGLDTEVTGQTTNILLESAQFDPLSVRHTSRALGIMSESNYRFERGVDPLGVDEASRRACGLICELTGGTPAEGVVDVWAEPFKPWSVSLRPQRTNHLLGVDIPDRRQQRILTSLGLKTQMLNGRIVCEIPSNRPDLTREIDLIEEVARLFEYDNIPTLGKLCHTVRPMSRNERIRRKIGETLVAAGYSEAITFSFIGAGEAGLFGVDNPVCVDANVRRTNNALRPTLTPSLLHAVKSNQDAGNNDVSLFELAAVFRPESSCETTSREYLEVGLVSTRGLRDVRGVVEALVERIAPNATLKVQPSDDIAECLLLDDEPVGAIGIIGPPKARNIQDYYGLEKSVATAVIRYDALASRAELVRTARVLPKFPPVRRDLSLIVDEAVTWGEILDALAGVEQPLRMDTQYVTTYRGKPVPAGKKSVTMTMEYRSHEGTLTGEEVDGQVEEIIAAMKKHFAAEIRT